MKVPNSSLETERVLVMAHGWGYNHQFFNLLLKTLPIKFRKTTLIVCLEAGYFPDQAKLGLMVQIQDKWVRYPVEFLHRLLSNHTQVPWIGFGHSLGFSRLLDYSIQWHSLFSLHGFTYFIKSSIHPTGSPPRLLEHMIKKAKHNMAEVLNDFHKRCGFSLKWELLNEKTLLADLESMKELNCTLTLHEKILSGTRIHVWAGKNDQIVSPELVKACFGHALIKQGNSLYTLETGHSDLACQTAPYTNTLLPLLGHY
jgi:pimeloyl-[acyl-carrier protein] methyl ester esterase